MRGGGFTDVFGLVGYVGGAVYVSHQPGFGFWDGVIWFYYVGRDIALHFAQLHP